MSKVLARPEVGTQSGRVAGEAIGGVHIFRGISYAAPPVGDLRWKPPQAPTSWDGVRDATQFAADCPQVYSPTPRIDSSRSRAPGMSEDCLYLNIWAPGDSAGEKAPVYVWFPGGGFIRGSAAEPTYDGQALARRGIVVVTVNHRVGAFGFLAHPGLTTESEHGASGNYGLLDTIAALRWIRDNIAAFGGDPDRVTISGQSSGGALVGNLFVSPLAKGLFQRVIAQSPGSFRPLGELKDAEAYGLKAGSDVASMRQLSVKDVLALAANYVPKARGLTTPRLLRTIVDGWSMPEQESELFVTGRFANVPLICGTCEDEGGLFVGRGEMATVEDYRAFMHANFRDNVEEALALYPAMTDAEVRPSYEAALGDTQFHYAARSMARVSSRVQPNTYRFLFTHRTGGAIRPAQHCDELPYVFGTLDDVSAHLGLKQPTEQERALAETLQDAWRRFMATGNPNGGSITNWPAYDPEQDQFIEFGDKVTLKSGHRLAHMALLDRNYCLTP